MALSRRDRASLSIGGSLLLIFIVVQFVVFPLVDKRKRLRKTIASRQVAVQEMRDMQLQYGQLNEQSHGLEKQLAQRSPDFSLFSFLEKMATESKIKDHILYMKPSTVTGDGDLRQVMVEMKLQIIGLKQLVTFLGRIESPQNVVTLKRISIQENKKVKGTLDVIMQVISIDQQGRNSG
ncbi:MAG: type II secretion system protein M [Desulfobulbaceae bacterium]|nr:type II secretion system protein M [Desulfobulbaceae bacterium]